MLGAASYQTLTLKGHPLKRSTLATADPCVDVSSPESNPPNGAASCGTLDHAKICKKKYALETGYDLEWRSTPPPPPKFNP